MEETKKIEPHTPYMTLLWSVLAFLFPVTAYMYQVMWKETQKETVKKGKWAAILGASLQILFVLVVILMTLLNSQPDSLTFLGISLRGFLFYVCFFFALEGTATLIFAHEYVVRHDGEEETKFFQIGRKIAIAETTLFSIISVYLIDAVLKTPLPKGIPFSSDKPTVAFYALFILFGAVMSLLIASNKIHKQGGRRDTLETIFYVAFPMGLVGARAWWVISEWNRTLAGNHTLAAILDVRSGGLAVQGGVLLGAWVGVWMYVEMKKKLSTFKILDAAIPGILIAQAIGRLGNFTNIEVYGQVADPSKWWFLPQIIIQQYESGLGHFVVPLFFVEALLNVAGYFFITYVLGGLLKKWLNDGDLAFSYLVWYGCVRFAIEPLRDQEYIMGTSQQMSIVFVALGVGLILLSHLLTWIRKKNPQLDENFLSWRRKVASQMEEKSKTSKILCSLPIIGGFYYGFYRFVKGHYYTGISWIIVGSILGWALDLYYIVTDKTLLMSKEKMSEEHV